MLRQLLQFNYINFGTNANTSNSNFKYNFIITLQLILVS